MCDGCQSWRSFAMHNMVVLQFTACNSAVTWFVNLQPPSAHCRLQKLKRTASETEMKLTGTVLRSLSALRIVDRSAMEPPLIENQCQMISILLQHRQRSQETKAASPFSCAGGVACLWQAQGTGAVLRVLPDDVELLGPCSA